MNSPVDEVAANLKAIRSTLPDNVKLVAVSKFHPVEYLRAAYDAGQRVFGESREQELTQKVAQMGCDDIEWHFIGHLQTNKVKHIAPYIHSVDAVDSLRLLAEINKQAAAAGRVIDVLLELHIAQEATKYGLTPDACIALLEGGEWREMANVHICGLMMMASNTDDEDQIRREFQQGEQLFADIKARFFASDPTFCQRSWGMSDDYPIAIECGSTMVRIGTAIFGPRVY